MRSPAKAQDERSIPQSELVRVRRLGLNSCSLIASRFLRNSAVVWERVDFLFAIASPPCGIKGHLCDRNVHQKNCYEVIICLSCDLIIIDKKWCEKWETLDNMPILK